MERSEVYKLIDGERLYQLTKWNEHTSTSKGIHTPEEWIVYMEDYLLEAKHILSREPMPGCAEKAMESIRKVTTMGVAAMEQNGCEPRK